MAAAAAADVGLAVAYPSKWRQHDHMLQQQCSACSRHSTKVYLLFGPNKAVFAPNRIYFSACDIYTGFIALETFYTILDMVGRRSSEPHENGLEKRPRNAFVSRVTMSGPVFRAKSDIIFRQAFLRMC